MSINIGGNTLSAGGFNTYEEVVDPTIVTDGLVFWVDAGNLSSYLGSPSYYNCGYGCQYYSSNPGCPDCQNNILDMSGYGNDGILEDTMADS